MLILICHHRYIGRYPSLILILIHGYKNSPMTHIGRYIGTTATADTDISVLPILAISADILYRPIPICQPYIVLTRCIFTNPCVTKPEELGTLLNQACPLKEMFAKTSYWHFELSSKNTLYQNLFLSVCICSRDIYKCIVLFKSRIHLRGKRILFMLKRDSHPILGCSLYVWHRMFIWG